ncbi:TPA: hypothetical protein ACNEZI_004884, partial [Escherichia coli]
VRSAVCFLQHYRRDFSRFAHFGLHYQRDFLRSVRFGQRYPHCFLIPLRWMQNHLLPVEPALLHL